MTTLMHFTSAAGNHLWQSTVLAAVAWVLTLALRKNQARTRYWLWMIASAKFLIPFSFLIAMGGYLRALISSPIVIRTEVTTVMEQIATPFPQPEFTSVMAPSSLGHNGGLWPVVLFAFWTCGFLFVALSWGLKWWRVRAAVRAASRSALIADVPVLSSPSLLEPGIVGIFRPVLMLPEGITKRLTPAQVDAIIAHEMCHVRRRDNLTAAIHMLVEGAFWFHPMVWWIGSRMVEERERACDEEVLRLGGDPEIYAEGILNVCKFYLESPLTCVSGISGSDLKKRIVRIMTARVASNLDLSRKLLLGAAALLVIAVPFVSGLDNATRLREQSPTTDWQATAGGKMSFDVASVKKNEAGWPPAGPAPHTNVPFGPEATYPPTGGLISITNYPVASLISLAYKLTLNDGKVLVSQLPRWAMTEHFDVEARAAGNPTKDQFRLMMQSLLADRFKLATHYEVRQVPTYSLVLVKPGKMGPQLRAYGNEDPCLAAAPSSPTVADGFPAACGDLQVLDSSQPGVLVRFGSRNMSMGLIATTLSTLGGLDRPIFDRTELTGTFDFILEWDRKPVSDTPSDTTGPTFIEALKDQLGLKLDAQTGSVNTFVVDHIEQPSTN